MTLVFAAPVAAATGPNQPTTDVSTVLARFSFVGADARSYEGTALVQRDNLANVATSGFFFAWRNLVQCGTDTPDPEDDFEGEERIDFTVDSLTPTSFTLADDLSSSSATLTGTGHRVHSAACDGAIIEDVVETHTVTFALTATARATKSGQRERIQNDDGTVTTIVVKEVHRPAAGTFDLDGTSVSVTEADLSHAEITETTR